MSSAPSNDADWSLTERAYQQIASAIARLEFKPGEALTQDRLARWLAISRTPVREALRRLEQDGIIQQLPGRGLVVAELTVRDVDELLELLAVLTPSAAQLAARRATDAERIALTHIGAALLEAARLADNEQWMTYDWQFYETLLGAAHNSRLEYAVLDARRRLQRITYNGAIDPEALNSDSRERLLIAQAIAAGDEQAAQQAMHMHLDQIGTRTLQFVRSYLVPIRGERF